MGVYLNPYLSPKGKEGKERKSESGVNSLFDNSIKKFYQGLGFFVMFPDNDLGVIWGNSTFLL